MICFKMKLSIFVFGLFCFGIDGSDIRSSLTFVIDDTGSMHNEIDDVKWSTNEIFDTVMNSNSTQIEDFVLVTFNDPTTELRVITKDRDDFKNALSKIRVGGGGLCPEVAMAGILQALQNSREGSYLYVFTDASADDYKKHKEVEALAQKMGCQITFLLTGICDTRESEDYKVYKSIAEATNGQVFHLEKRGEMKEILKYVMYSIESRKQPLASKTFPRGNGSFNVTVDGAMNELSISVSGESPTVLVTSDNGTVWPTIDITRLKEAAAVKIVDVTPGVYEIEVGGKSETHVEVSASTSVHFDHGFSIIAPSAITDTVRTPIPGEESYISIKLSTEGADVQLFSVQILNMDDTVIFEQELKLVNKSEQFYSTAERIIPPGHLFRVAIRGYDHKSKTYLTRISLTPVIPQEVPIEKEIPKRAPKLECETKITAVYNKSLQLKCKVTGYPKPNVTWQSDDRSALFNHDVVALYLPYDYMSLLDIRNVIKNATYTVRAVNSVSEDHAYIKVETKIPYYITPLAIPKDTVIEYQKSAQIPCKVDAYPPVTVSWLKGLKPLKSDENIEVSADGTMLTIRSMEPYLEDNYVCEARSSVTRKFFRFRVDIIGVEEPEINKAISSIETVKNSKVDIRCPIIKGSPTPTISWYFKNTGTYTFTKLYKTTDTIHFDKVDATNAGTYRCEVQNIIGMDYHSIELNVEYEPSISKPYKSIVSVNQGGKVILRCPAVGNPAPEVTWFADGHRIEGSPRHQLYGGTLRFLAESNDAGNYECEAKNSLGVDKISIRLNVYGPPHIESPRKSSIEQMEGLPLALSCRADGSPRPRITWLYRSADPTVPPKKYPPSESSGWLNFKKISLGQSGEYTCLATNSRGSTNITYTVSVLARPIIQYTTKVFDGVKGDLQLRIPCNATGNPKPEITWVIKGSLIAAESEWYSIGSDGSLIIKNIDMSSEGDYTCYASNRLGEVKEDFNVIVHDSPDTGFLSNVVHLKRGTSAIIPCSIPYKRTDRLQWFKDGEPLPSPQLELRDVTAEDDGTYTCRVSAIDGPARSSSTKVVVGFEPRFENDDDKNIEFSYRETRLMDCSAYGVPEPEVKWYHDGREMSLNEFKYELQMNDDSDRGHYTCVVSNRHGFVRQEFVVSSFECLVDTDKFNGYQPLILTVNDKPTNFKITDGFIRIPKHETVKFICPSRFDTIPYKEIKLTCKNEDQFEHLYGNIYSYSDLKCRDQWNPTIKSTGANCAGEKSIMLKVGFEVKDSFQDVYEVCLDKVTGNPIYTKLNMQPSLSNVANGDAKWFNSGPPIDLATLYDCSKQNEEITRTLSMDFHRRDGCCFAKRMLVSPLDVAPGLPQTTTYTNVNVVPHWSTCNSKNWEEVERRIRELVTSSDRPLQVFTGTAGDLYLSNRWFEQKNVTLASREKKVQVPKYLWKVVQDARTQTSLAIIQVNVPDLKLSEAYKYNKLCTDICENVEWMKSGDWLNLENGFTYCCSLEDFQRAFRYPATIPDYRDLLLRMSYDFTSDLV